MNYGYPKIGLYFRISIIHFNKDILKLKKMMYVPKGYNDFSLVREWRHSVWLIGDCELIIYPIGSNAKSLLFDSLFCIPGNTWAIKIYLNFKPKDR